MPSNSTKRLLQRRGVRVCGKDLEKTLAGTPLVVAYHQDEVEILKVSFGTDMLRVCA